MPVLVVSAGGLEVAGGRNSSSAHAEVSGSGDSVLAEESFTLAALKEYYHNRGDFELRGVHSVPGEGGCADGATSCWVPERWVPKAFRSGLELAPEAVAVG